MICEKCKKEVSIENTIRVGGALVCKECYDSEDFFTWYRYERRG
ncbi:MAG: hypothetical protein QW609_04220 [Candidatus Aenigmatarchaeota archaeon]